MASTTLQDLLLNTSNFSFSVFYGEAMSRLLQTEVDVKRLMMIFHWKHFKLVKKVFSACLQFCRDIGGIRGDKKVLMTRQMLILWLPLTRREMERKQDFAKWVPTCHVTHNTKLKHIYILIFIFSLFIFWLRNMACLSSWSVKYISRYAI